MPAKAANLATGSCAAALRASRSAKGPGRCTQSPSARSAAAPWPRPARASIPGFRPAAGALTARHPVFHRGLARIDEAVAPPIDRLRQDAVAAGGLGNRDLTDITA